MRAQDKHISDELKIGNIESLLFTVQPGREYIQIFVSTTYWVTLLANFFEVASVPQPSFMGEPSRLLHEAHDCLQQLIADVQTAILALDKKIVEPDASLWALDHEFKRLLNELRKCQELLAVRDNEVIANILRSLSPEARSLLATLRIKQTLNIPGRESPEIPEYWFINLSVFAAPAGSEHQYSGDRQLGDVVKRIGSNQSLLLRHEQRLYQDTVHADLEDAPAPDNLLNRDIPTLTLAPNPDPLSRSAKHPAAIVLRRSYIESTKLQQTDLGSYGYTHIGSSVWVSAADTHMHMLSGSQQGKTESARIRAVVESCQLRATMALQAESVRDILERSEDSQRSASGRKQDDQSAHEESLVERMHGVLAYVAQHTTALEGLASSCTLSPNPYRLVDAVMGLNPGIRQFLDTLTSRIEHVGQSYMDQKRAKEKAKEYRWRITQSVITGLAGFELADAGSKIGLSLFDRDDHAYFLTLQMKTTPELFDRWIETQSASPQKPASSNLAYSSETPGNWKDLQHAIWQFHILDMTVSILCFAVAVIVAVITYKLKPAGDQGTD